MQIKSGILLKILVPVVVLVVTMIGVKSCGSQKSAQPQSGNSGAAALTREELSLLGIEGDTSLVNTINNIAERDQFLEREIVFATDEAHMISELDAAKRIARELDKGRGIEVSTG